MQDTIDKRPQVVQCFVDGSAKGWYNYLYGDNKAANDLIKKDNPEMTDGQIEFTIAKMKEFGLVDSGAAAEGGIGCLSGDQVKSFFDKMVAAKVVKADLDYSKVYTDAFVCNRVGIELKK